MAKCEFCGKKLPEEGYTHYMLVETRFQSAIACCAGCRKEKKLKMVDLRRGT